MPEWWEETFFENPTSALAANDDDGDGQTNAAKFRVGTSPTNPNEYLRITSVAGGPPFVVEFPTVLGKTFRVEYSDDPAEWFPLATGVAGTSGLVQVPDGGASRRDEAVLSDQGGVTGRGSALNQKSCGISAL
jgi:hypothetical protein